MVRERYGREVRLSRVSIYRWGVGGWLCSIEGNMWCGMVRVGRVGSMW